MSPEALRPKGETTFAIFTLSLCLPYFLAETYSYQIYVGFPNYFLGYFVDLIAMVLMLTAGVASLRNKSRSAAGWLAGAWGFVACLNYRAFAWRYYEWRDTGQVSNEPVIGLFVLAGLLFLSFSSFVYALYLARPR